MIIINEDDLIESVAEALQYISYYHPPDYITALGRAYELEQSPAAKDAIAQILTNSRMCAEGHRPICQDTGIVNVFVKLGMDIRWNAKHGLSDMINEGVRRAYLRPANLLRPSIVSPPEAGRKNTMDNTPAVIHCDVVEGAKIELTIAAKGAGSENQSRFVMLNPSDSVIEWVLKTVPTMGAGWCPPGIIGIGIGGTAEKAMVLAKQALMQPIDIQDVIARGPKDWVEDLRIQLYRKINALGIGAQGLGGLSTVLDVKILTFPTHAASKPVALIPNCAATRHVDLVLDGSGPAKLEVPSLDNWPAVHWSQNAESSLRINLDNLTREDAANWKAGQTLLLSGKVLTARDAAHKRLIDRFAAGTEPPVRLANRVIYYVGPVSPVRDEAVGPAGPTTAKRMDNFTEWMLKAGVVATIGKGERGQETINAIKQYRSPYLIAVGGAAYLISKAIRAASVVAFEDLGMEAIYEFDVRDMPVTVAVDANGVSVHHTGPMEWQSRSNELAIISK